MAANQNCLFCKLELSTSTKKQHIIQASIGGTLTTQNATCNDCNEYFAASIDGVVAKKFSQCMNALAFALKADAPTLQVWKKGSNEAVKMEPGNVPHARAKVILKSDGGVSIRAKDEERALKLLKTTGKRREEIKSFVYETEPATGMVIHDGIVVHEDELRSARKIALEFLAHRAPDLLPHLAVEEEIKYIRHGEINPKLRPTILPVYPEKELVAAGFGQEPFSHLIWLECGNGTVEALVCLFGSVSYRFQISGYSGPPRSLIYQKNILKSSGPDLFGAAVAGTALPAPVPMPRDMLIRESGRLRQLYIDACWYVDMNCREKTISFYWMQLRTGKSPGETIDVSHEALSAIMKARVGKVFSAAFVSRESEAQSDEIFDRITRIPTFMKESVERPSEKMGDAIWAMHVELMKLHKGYVGIPDYGYENYDITPFPPQVADDQKGTGSALPPG